MQTTDILINQIITQALASRIAAKMPGHMAVLTMKFISMIAAVIGLFLLMAVLYQWLEVHFSMQQTLLCMALAFFGLSLSSLIVSAMIYSVRKKVIQQVGHDFFKTTSEFYESIIGEISGPLKDHRGAALAAVVLAGLLVGKKL